MFQGSYVFSQIMSLISHKQFQTLVSRHNGDYKVKDFKCWKQFLCMAFGQLTHRESLSDTMLCLKASLFNQVLCPASVRLHTWLQQSAEDFRLPSVGNLPNPHYP